MSDFLSAVFYMPAAVRERILELYRQRPDVMAEMERRFARKRDAMARGDRAEMDLVLREEKDSARRFFDDFIAGKALPGCAI